MRKFLYKALKYSNDFSAIKRGKVGKRFARRTAGTFEETTSAWTGTFTADDGKVYEIIDGYIIKEVA